jgi:hypothetical protein
LSFENLAAERPYPEDGNVRYDTCEEDGALDSSYFAIYNLEVLDEVFNELKEELLRENQQWYTKEHVTRYRSICLLHNQLPDFVAVLRPNTTEYITARKRARKVIKCAILPALIEVFNIVPSKFPFIFCLWINQVSQALERRFNKDHDRDRAVVVTCDEYAININFCASGSVMHRSGSAHYQATTAQKNNYAKANVAKLTYVQALSGVRVNDPTINEIGDPRDLRNFVPDSGATDDMTPRLEDLFDVVGGQKLGVEVADGHIIKCTTTGKSQWKC